MASKMNTSCQLAIFICLLFVFDTSTAFKFSSFKDKGALDLKSQRQDNADLAALVRPMPDDQSGIYAHALQLLSAMQASPSCNRLAASTLLDSCHSIDGSKHDSEASFEDARSIYAAQLAMCELVSAESSIPHSCQNLAPVFDSKAHKAVSQKAVRKGQLSQCLQALESRPQWWTSYSNSRQNAVVMCQAARVDIEKDELVRLHRSMVETNAEANSALARATSQANAALNQLHEEFALAKQAFQEQLVQDLDASTAKAQSFLERLVSNMDSAVQVAIKKVTSATKDIEADAVHLSENVRKANVDSIDLQKNVGKVFQQVVEGSAELAAVQTQQAGRSREMAIELQGSLQNMREQEINAMLSLFYSIHNQLQSSNELVASLHTRQKFLDERLISLDESFAAFESRAEAFQAVQARQAEVQARLYNEMQIEMHVTRGLLDNITSSATSLHTTIQTTSALIGHFASLLSNLRGAARWIPLLFSCFLLLFVFHIFRGTFVPYILGVIACVINLSSYSLLLSGNANRDRLPSDLPYNEHPLLMMVVFLVFAVLQLVTIICRFTNLLNLIRPRQLDITSDMPNLDLEKPDHPACTYSV